MNYTIHLDEQQMQVLRDSLDFYERVLGLGQLEEVEHRWRWDMDVLKRDFQARSDGLRHSLYAAKSIGWDLSSNSSRSVRSELIPTKYRIAYDMTQIIRKVMSDVSIEKAKIENDEKTVRFLNMTVDQNSYWPTYPQQPPIKITWSG